MILAPGDVDLVFRVKVFEALVSLLVDLPRRDPDIQVYVFVVRAQPVEHPHELKEVHINVAGDEEDEDLHAPSLVRLVDTEGDHAEQRDDEVQTEYQEEAVSGYREVPLFDRVIDVKEEENQEQYGEDQAEYHEDVVDDGEPGYLTQRLCAGSG